MQFNSAAGFFFYFRLKMGSQGANLRSRNASKNNAERSSEYEERKLTNKCSNRTNIWRKMFSRMAFSIKVLSKECDREHNTSKWKDLAWKMVNGIMAVFFFAAALLQINDPDPALWIALYLMPASICSTVVAYPTIQELRLFKAFTVFQLTLCLSVIAYTIYNASNEFAKHKGNILVAEEGREAAGLTIVVAWLCITLLIDSKSVQTLRPTSWIKIVVIVLAPLIFATLWAYTIDFSHVPEHCRSIIKGLQ